MCVESFVFLKPSTLALTVFPSSLLWSYPGPEGRDLIETFYLELCVSRSLTLYILSSCGSLYLSPSAAEEASLMVAEVSADL